MFQPLAYSLITKQDAVGTEAYITLDFILMMLTIAWGAVLEWPISKAPSWPTLGRLYDTVQTAADHIARIQINLRRVALHSNREVFPRDVLSLTGVPLDQRVRTFKNPILKE